MKGPGHRSTRLIRRRLVHVVVAAPGLALGHANGSGQSVDQSPELCLQQVYESTLGDFEPIGLSTFDDPDANPAITMWSRTSLLVISLSVAEPTIKSTFRAALSGVQPFGAALTRWNDATPVVELFDVSDGTIRTMELATDVVAETRTPPVTGGASAGAASALGVLRTETGWVRAQRVMDPISDTSAIVLLGSGFARPSGYPAPTSPLLGTAKVPTRRIDRILHVRRGIGNGPLVTEAAFPFTIVEFTSDGTEAWRVAPAPDELRDQLGEADLRYVIATPAIKADQALLNTLVALRSGRRVSALWLPDATSPRYRRIPDDLSFLGAIPSHRLLVATRSGQPYSLILFRWHWTDQNQSCTRSPT